MSWAAHELENYVIQRHVGVRASFLAIAVGAFLPDLFSKIWVYGVTINGRTYGDGGVVFHRDWPGAGFTHSLLFGALFATVVLAATKNRPWALGLLIGQWAHVLTDINDTAGTMLFFPFSTEQVSTGLWKHAGDVGRYGDAEAYYSSPGGIWDLFWVCLVLLNRKVLTAEYFRTVVRVADPRVWNWFESRLRMPERALLALYRGLFFYGAVRAVTWMIWTHAVRDAPWDVSWGGPWWISRVDLSASGWWEAAWSLSIGALLLAAFLAVAWQLVIRRLWLRCAPVSA